MASIQMEPNLSGYFIGIAQYQLYSSELYDYDIDAFLYDDEYSFNSNVPNKEDGVYYFRELLLKIAKLRYLSK